MPEQKYHCDYCDRDLVDNVQSVRKHNATAQHQQNVRLWYESVQNPVYASSLNIPICLIWQQTGFCPLGPTCPFRHFVQPPSNPQSTSVIPCGVLQSNVLDIDDEKWVPVDEQTQKRHYEQEEQLPKEFQELLLPTQSDLPPSLLPISDTILYSYPRSDWG
ncbi:hypothetical protein WA158_003396 [Blastocystis sp. Blastoise]